MMEGGNEDRHSLNMVHAHIKLILQHSSSLITHTCKSFFSLRGSLGAHVPEDPQGYQSPTNYPSNQNPFPPCFPNSFGPNTLVVAMVDLENVP